MKFAEGTSQEEMEKELAKNKKEYGDGFRDPDDVDETYAEDDWLSDEAIGQYKKAAQVAYDFSIGKMQEQGDQERETIGKGAEEQRTTNQQKQRFSEADEARDYRQSQKAYRF